MGELQATIELTLHLHKFCNVDLFQRGYYQVRVYLRASPKLPAKIELSLPRNNSNWKDTPGIAFPACVVDTAMVSKTFQILYRNEEVILDDFSHFKLHLIVDSHKIAETLDRADLQLLVELWFSESTFAPNHHNAIQCVSSRSLHLHFSPTRGLHYHLPVLFDYFHLSAITMTIHAALVSLHQPYIKKTILALVNDCGGKSGKSWSSPKLSNRAQQSNMENVFFGGIGSTIKCGGGSGTTSWRLAQARRTHRTICTLLLAAHTALAAQLEAFLAIIPPWASSSNSASNGAASSSTNANANAAPSTPQPTRLKIDNLSDVAKECYYAVIGGHNKSQKSERRQTEKIRTVDSEEDFLLTANSDIAHLCAENILLWHHFLMVVGGSEPIRQHLSRQHHLQRARRFAEAFFVIDNPRPSATGCYDSNYQNYAMISEAVRRSRYFALLPPLPVECLEMDGDATTLPVIFEDQYQHVAEFARRRSIANRKSENFLNNSDIQIAIDQVEQTENKFEVLNPPDITKPEPPPFNANNDTKVKAENKNAAIFHVTNKSAKNKDVKFSASSNDKNKKSSSNTSFDIKLLNEVDFDALPKKDRMLAKYGTHPLKAESHSKFNANVTLDRNVKSSKSSLSAKKRTFLDDTRLPFTALNSSAKISGNSATESEEQLISKGSKVKKGSGGGSLEALNISTKDDKPPVPPRTDKMPKDFKPPIPPKLHKIPIPRNSLKEKLKNNLRLELRLSAPQGNAYKKAKFKVKLIQRAQQLRSSGSKHKKSNTNATDPIILLKYRPLEPSLSMPYNLGANTPGSNSIGGIDQPMRHSQSTLSMPSFLWDMANSSSPGVAESLPDLLASDSESSSSEIQATQTHPPRIRTGHPPILTNVEVGLVSASDHALLEVGKTKQGQANTLSKPKKVSSPLKKLPETTKPTVGLHTSSSNSDITSEQSGWVSNSSRQSSGSSSGQVSPDLTVKKYPLPDMLPTSIHYNSMNKNGENYNAVVMASPGIDLVTSSIPSVKHWDNPLDLPTPILPKPSPVEPTPNAFQNGTKESSIRSTSHDHLKICRKKSPNRREVKKSQSLQRVNNPRKSSGNLFEQVPIPPPPKEFQDPSPALREVLRSKGFATTGRIVREETRKGVKNLKDRPRSESPCTQNRKTENVEDNALQGKQILISDKNCDFEIEDSNLYESISEVLGDIKESIQNTQNQSHDKFNSLPSMRRRHQSSTYPERPSKRSSRKLANTPDHLSEPPSTPFVSQTLQSTDRSRTQSAPPANQEKADVLKDSLISKEVRFQRRSNPIPGKIEPLSHFINNKCSLLELFLEQQGASAWAQRELLKETHKSTKITSTILDKKTDQDRKKAPSIQSTRQKSKSQPDLNDSFDEMSNIPSPPKAPSPSRTEPKCTCPSELRKERLRMEEPPPDVLPQKLNPPVPDTLAFLKSKEEFKQQINFQGYLYSDFANLASTISYFHVSDDCRVLSPDGLHLIVCVHGLDGNSADLRLIKTFLEMGLPGANLDFLMSERNQGDTFSNFETLTDRLVSEIVYHIEAFNLNPKRISFVGHSLGNIIIRGAVSHPQMKPFLSKLYTFLSLSGPHLGTLYNNSGLVNMGMWFMQKWKKSGSLLQLALKDRVDIRQTFLYKLSQRSQLHNFKNVLLCGSSQDRYVPLHSARIELCRQAVKDNSVIGSAYREMVSNLLQPIISSPSVTFVRFDIHHALASTANALIGRAAHIAVLDSELFIEKFLLVTGIKYFK